jgi:hypothetical protein
MKTVTIQIGNSDDKLTQKEWSSFCEYIGFEIVRVAAHVHFSGASDTTAPWQNTAWVFEIEPSDIEPLKGRIATVRAEYQQDSVAWTEGDTSFI